MPRGQIEHLKATRFKPRWKHKTKMVRLPECIEDEIRAIAEWADNQSNPKEKLQELLKQAK